jgi:hypothetical protein
MKAGEKNLESAVIDLIEQMRLHLASPSMAFSSSLAPLRDTDAFGRLVALGEPALPVLVSRLAEGDFFLNDVVLSILGLSVAELSLEPYPSEQELSKLLMEIAAAPVVEFFWTAASAPSSLPQVTSWTVAAAPMVSVRKNDRRLQALRDQETL